jgi:hypothetical protein
MSNLFDISTKFGTNKAWHGYLSFYEKLFETKRNTYSFFFEIGIDQGGSILAWKEYFQNCHIYGIDLKIPNCVVNESRISVSICDQENTSQLEDTIKNWNNPLFDCILDDGGHTVKQQRISIETLWKHVKKGGYYIIEDLHTNIQEFQGVHPHISKNSGHINENPTVHEKIISTMRGSKTQFKIPFEEIDEIYYYCNPQTMSLSCAFLKK